MAKNLSRNAEAAKLVLNNAAEFLNVGIRMLSSQNIDSRDAKVAVLAIQTAVELFAKYRIITDEGIRGIIQKGSVPKGGSLLKAAELGHFTTIGFEVCLKKIEQTEILGEWSLRLFKELQGIRNTLVHFAGVVDVDDLKATISAIIVRVLAVFATGQERDAPEMETYGRFLDKANFDFLLADENYLVEAFDAAQEDPEAEDVFDCWNCQKHTLTLRQTDNYFCWTCGIGTFLEAASFSDCWNCKRKRAVCYDALNQTNGIYFGKCLTCGERAYVACCSWCGRTSSEASPDLVSHCKCHLE